MSDKGTVIYIGGFELPDKNAAAQRVIANALIIREIGYTPVLIGINKDLKNNTYFRKASQNYYDFDCWDLPYPSSTTGWLKYLHSIDGFVEIVGYYKNIKAVICYNYQSIAFERIRTYCKKNNIRIISDCTEWYKSDVGSLPFRVIKYLDTFFRMRYINKKVDALIVATTFLKNYYYMRKSVVVPTLIANLSFKNSVCQSELHDSPKLVYAGIPFRLGTKLNDRHMAKDRLDISIRALYNISKSGIMFTYDIFGITKSQYLVSIPEDKSILDELEDFIHFHGSKSSEIIKEEISNADFTFLIRDDNRSTKAGFPTKFTESLICGTPVITNKTSDIDMYLKEGLNGFILEKNQDRIDEEKLTKILTLDKDTRRELKEYCQKSDLFNIFNWISELREVLESQVI